MIQKILKVLLIGQVQEYFFINFTWVTLTFLVFHQAGLLSYIYNGEGGSSKTGWASVIFFGIGFIILSIALIKHKNHKFLEEKGMISLIPTLAIGIVSIAALAIAFEGKRNTLEIIITIILLVRYSVKMLILGAYLFLDRQGAYNNRVYRAIKLCFDTALGDYQVTGWESVITLVVAIVSVYLLTLSSANPFSQYLIAFSAVDIMSYGLEHVRNAGILKN